MLSTKRFRALVVAVALLWSALLSFGSYTSAAPYAFAERDFIECGIYFSAGGRARGVKLLTVRFGDIDGYYNKFFPDLNPKHI